MSRYKNEPFNLPSNDEVIERVEKAESLIAINKKLKAQNEILLRATNKAINISVMPTNKNREIGQLLIKALDKLEALERENHE